MFTEHQRGMGGRAITHPCHHPCPRLSLCFYHDLAHSEAASRPARPRVSLRNAARVPIFHGAPVPARPRLLQSAGRVASSSADRCECHRRSQPSDSLMHASRFLGRSCCASFCILRPSHRIRWLRILELCHLWLCING